MAFPMITIDDNDSLARSIQKIHYGTGETFIVIIDEYDILVREQLSYLGSLLMDEYQAAGCQGSVFTCPGQ